jgi:hypothetical protein
MPDLRAWPDRSVSHSRKEACRNEERRRPRAILASQRRNCYSASANVGGLRSALIDRDGMFHHSGAIFLYPDINFPSCASLNCGVERSIAAPRILKI